MSTPHLLGQDCAQLQALEGAMRVLADATDHLAEASARAAVLVGETDWHTDAAVLFRAWARELRRELLSLTAGAEAAVADLRRLHTSVQVKHWAGG
jgi:hypothetical protein